MKVELGMFEVTSGKVIVSDPCYELNLGDRCQGVLENVKTGLWKAHVEKGHDMGWGICCEELVAKHSDIDSVRDMNIIPASFTVCVDSGQAGIFDASVYRNDETVQKSSSFIPDEPWYSSCCDQTLSDQQAGIINGGVVSSSGYGDGSYEAWYAMDTNGEIVAIGINFNHTNADDEDEDIEDDDIEDDDIDDDDDELDD